MGIKTTKFKGCREFFFTFLSICSQIQRFPFGLPLCSETPQTAMRCENDYED